MGCGTHSRPEGALVQHTGTQVHPEPTQGSRISSRQSSRTSGTTRTRSLKKSCSGIEGRHGFVPAGRTSIGSFHEQDIGKGLVSANIRDEDDKHQAQHWNPIPHLAVTPFQLISNPLQLLKGNKTKQADEEDSEPDVQIDVVFLFKKALEAKYKQPMQEHNLEDIVQAVVHDLDPQACGSIARSAVVAYIQSTCIAADMARPTHDQVTRVFSDLPFATQDHVETETFKQALKGLPWRMIAVQQINRALTRRTSAQIPGGALQSHNSGGSEYTQPLMRRSSTPLMPTSSGTMTAATSIQHTLLKGSGRLRVSRAALLPPMPVVAPSADVVPNRNSNDATATVVETTGHAVISTVPPVAA